MTNTDSRCSCCGERVNVLVQFNEESRCLGCMPANTNCREFTIHTRYAELARGETLRRARMIPRFFAAACLLGILGGEFALSIGAAVASYVVSACTVRVVAEVALAQFERPVSLVSGSDGFQLVYIGIWSLREDIVLRNAYAGTMRDLNIRDFVNHTIFFPDVAAVIVEAALKQPNRVAIIKYAIPSNSDQESELLLHLLV